MEFTRLSNFEQAHMLQKALLGAAVVREFGDSYGFDEGNAISFGVPNGAHEVLVFLEGVKLSREGGVRRTMFCNCHSARALGPISTNGLPYPAPENTKIAFACKIPKVDGVYPVTLLISISSKETLVVVKAFDHQLPEVSEDSEVTETSQPRALVAVE